MPVSPDPIMSVMSTLKQATQPYHQRLERLVPVLDPGFSRADYLVLIKAFWGYLRPLEARLTAFPGLRTCLPDATRRVKLPLLEADLRAFGVNGDALERLPVCGELPSCDDLDSALGCLYVLEGATLGGQVISRHLKQSLDLDAGTGTAFFTGYGEATESMWQVFGDCVTAAIADEATLVRSACETFLTLERWLCASLNRRGERS